MLKIGVLEDEAEQMERLRSYLQIYQESHPGFDYILDTYTRGMKLLEEYKTGVDLLFLDIRVPDMSGMEAARHIRARDQNVMIVFVTNLTQYAIEGYSVSAYDYILKPLLYDAFQAKMDRIRKELSHHKVEKRLMLKTKQELYQISVNDIFYVEVEGHTLVFHTGSGEIPLWGTLSKYEEELEDSFFSRCNACYLVNLRYVERIKCGELYLTDGSVLFISKSKRKSFLGDLARYKGGSR